MLETLLNNLGNSIVGTVSVIMMLLFFKHLRHRDNVDTTRHENCEKTITNIVTKHEDSQKALLDTFRNEK